MAKKKRQAEKTSNIQKLGTNHKIVENKSGTHEDWGTGTGAQRRQRTYTRQTNKE